MGFYVREDPLCNHFFIFIRFKYIPVFDTDELIVPVEQKNWGDMMKKITHKKSSENVGNWQFNRYNFIFNSSGQSSSLFDNQIKIELRGTVMIIRVDYYLHLYSAFRWFQEHFKSKQHKNCWKSLWIFSNKKTCKECES